MNRFHHKTKEKTEPTEAQKAGKRLVLQNGMYASVLLAAVFAAVILLNLVVRALPSQYTEFDISTGKMFTLSDTTQEALAALDRDVTAYYLGQSGNEDANITRILDRYAGASSHFRWSRRDPALYPTLMQQYQELGASSDSVILTCGEKTEVVPYSELYEVDYSEYYTTGSYSYHFAAENALTTALANVTRETGYVLYQLTGHGETALGSDFTDTLQNSGVTVRDLNLMTTVSVPEDAAALVINAPSTDLAATDADALRTYLVQGGSVLVTTDLTCATPTLDALLAEFGMTRQPGLLVEQDPDRYAYRYGPTYLVPERKNNEITAGVRDGMMVFAPIAQGILTEEAEDLTYTTMLSTTSGAYAMLDYATAQTVTRGSDDPEGPFAIAVAAEQASTGAKLVWMNCGNLLRSDMNNAVSGGNAQLLTGAVNWMNGAEGAVVIDAKSMSATYLSVPGGTAGLLGLLLVIVLPAACLIVGAAVLLVRRRR